jgi:hypothetical protein
MGCGASTSAKPALEAYPSALPPPPPPLSAHGTGRESVCCTRSLSGGPPLARSSTSAGSAFLLFGVSKFHVQYQRSRQHTYTFSVRAPDSLDNFSEAVEQGYASPSTFKRKRSSFGCSGSQDDPPAPLLPAHLIPAHLLGDDEALAGRGRESRTEEGEENEAAVAIPDRRSRPVTPVLPEAEGHSGPSLPSAAIEESCCDEKQSGLLDPQETSTACAASAASAMPLTTEAPPPALRASAMSSPQGQGR